MFEFLVAGEIRHVLSGVGHPQTNGKIERFFGEVKARPATFADAGEIVAWWNTTKPHMSPDFRVGEMPCEAFEARMPPEGRGLLMPRGAASGRRGNDFGNPRPHPACRHTYTKSGAPAPAWLPDRGPG